MIFNNSSQQPIEKPKYSDIKKCVLKKEAGELTEDCKNILNKISREE